MKRVLFVDDEPRILDGLKRMLRSQRHAWRMVFANSAQEALAAMEAEPFHVVVTDVMMPSMNGVEFLKEVQVLHPGTARIVLSGHSDVEAAMRSVSVSHQFLSKPCDSSVLREAVERVCGLSELLEAPGLRNTLGAIVELPVLPRIYNALAHALSKEVSAKEVAEIVEQDAGIAAKIMQLVSSSYFGVRTQITRLDHAVSYLGVTTIRDLVLSFDMFRQFEGHLQVPGFSVEVEHNHSLLTARIARLLLDEKVAAEQAFLAAMFHDVGKLVMAKCLAPSFKKVLQAARESERPLHEIEEGILGVSHAEIGAYVLGLWGVPYPVVEAIAYHHNPGRVHEHSTFGVLGATHVADALAREQISCERGTGMLDEAYLERVGVVEKLPEWRLMAEGEAHAESEAA